MNKKITFPELIETVATATETSKRTSEVFLKELFAVISNSLVNGENVRIKNFGQFKLTEVGERKSVNVNTGEEMQIPSHTKVTFTPDKSLADAINMPFASFETVEISGNATEEELKMMSSADQLPEKATESLPQEEDVAVAGDDVKEVEQESADDVVVAGGDDDVATLDEQPEVENSSMKEQPAVITEETGDTRVEADDAEKQEDEEDAVTVSDEAESGDAEGEESGGGAEEADSDMSEQEGGEIEYYQDGVLDEHVQGAGDGIFYLPDISAHPRYDVPFPFLGEESERKAEELVVDLCPDVPHYACPQRHHNG